MLCSSVLLAHVDARVYSKNRLKAKFNERHINKLSIAVWGASKQYKQINMISVTDSLHKHIDPVHLYTVQNNETITGFSQKNFFLWFLRIFKFDGIAPYFLLIYPGKKWIEDKS